MNVILPPKLESFAREQVGHGLFSTEDEVIQEAVRLLQRDETLERLKLEEMRRLVAVGLEQADRGELALLDMDAIRAEGRRRLAQRNDGGFHHAAGVTDAAGC